MPEEATQVEYWVGQLRHTVRFAQGMSELLQDPQRIFLETGPGQALARLTKTNSAGTHTPTTISSMPAMPKPENEAACLLKAVGMLWLSGGPVDWENFHSGEGRRRIPLPTYPFEGERYWIDPAPARQADSRSIGSGKNPKIEDWFYLPSWRRSVLTQEQPSTEPQQWMLFTERCELASSLRQQLRAEGHNVIMVYNGAEFQQHSADEFTINPARIEDYQSLMKAVPAAAFKIVHLWSLTLEHVTATGVSLFTTVQSRGYYSLLWLSQAIAEAAGKADILVVSDRLHQIDSLDAPFPEKQPLLAVCQVIPQELPQVRFRSIEIDSSWTSGLPQELASRIFDESKSVAKEMFVAYRGTRRLVRGFDPVKLGPNCKVVRKLKHKGVYVITGGFGGVGLSIAEHLARSFAAKLVLASRTALPARDLWPKHRRENPADPVSVRIRQVEELEAMGAEVLAVSLDVTDAAQMKSVFDLAEHRFGKIDGIFHTAGVTTGDSLFKSFTELGTRESEIQFGPKVYGVYALQEALKGRRPDFCLLFSSNAAILGGLGYLTYVAANLFMDAFSHTASVNGTAWISANWDPWPKEMKRFKEVKTSVDQYAMTASESLEALTKTLEHIHSGQVVIATGDLEARLNIWINDASGANATESSAARPNLSIDYVKPANDLENAIAAIWQRILGIDRIGRNDNFFDLGGHSLLATRLISQLRDEFHCEVPINKFFEAPTIGEVAELIRNIKLGEEEDNRSEILAMLAKLSDEEVGLELKKRIAV
jgi:acyl transferase domain-containing protein/acyl carrier protein